MSTLSDLFSSRVKAEVLRLLFGLDATELHLREIERRSGLADATVRQELKRLNQLHLVQVRRDGNRSLYRANLTHPLYGDLRNLVLKTSGLAEVLREALGELLIDVAFVFGSGGAGTSKPESDVDLMVIGDLSLRQLARTLAGTSEKLGRELNPHVFSAREFSRRRIDHDHFIRRVLDSPKVFVIGTQHELERLGS